MDTDNLKVTRKKARTIKNYHYWLEKELSRSISLDALRRCVKRENLKVYLDKPDFDDDVSDIPLE
jgi:hypothetical protein